MAIELASPMTPEQREAYDRIWKAAIENVGPLEREAFINGARQAAWVAVSIGIEG